MDAGDSEEESGQDEEEEYSPPVDPYLREPSSKAEVWCEVRCMIGCRSRCILEVVVISHLMIASGVRWRHGRKGLLSVLRRRPAEVNGNLNRRAAVEWAVSFWYCSCIESKAQVWNGDY